MDIRPGSAEIRVHPRPGLPLRSLRLCVYILLSITITTRARLRSTSPIGMTQFSSQREYETAGSACKNFPKLWRKHHTKYSSVHFQYNCSRHLSDWWRSNISRPCFNRHWARVRQSCIHHFLREVGMFANRFVTVLMLLLLTAGFGLAYKGYDVTWSDEGVLVLTFQLGD